MGLGVAVGVVQVVCFGSVCENLFDGAVFEDEGDIVWGDVFDGGVAGAGDIAGGYDVPEGDVVGEQELFFVFYALGSFGVVQICQ